jgi:glycosyltransferase involved in cell wall biosynthesis
MTIKGRVSILIPARNEVFLMKTIKDILAKAEGDIEVIAVLDGYWPTNYTVKEVQYKDKMIQDSRVKYLHHGYSQGMRAGINHAASIATGEYLLKSDAHVMYDQGFDTKLKADMEENWVVIPRRKRLDAENWQVQDVGKPDVDYEFLCSPSDKGAKGSIWTDRILERFNKPEYDIDENMSFQGSCWFTTAHHFHNNLEGMQEEGYGSFVREAQEIGLKTWLGGGKVMTNKKTWYAHLHKGPKHGRMYFLDKMKMIEGEQYCDDYWFNNRYPKAVHDLAWLIERFSPVPTWTPELIEQVREI